MKFPFSKQSKCPLFSKISHPEKTRWGNRGIYIFLTIGVILGLSMWWRFPSFALRYSGGAFLIAYLIGVAVIVFPMLIYESSFGQKTQRSLVRSVERMNKGWRWYGHWGFILSSIIALYMVIVLVWSVHFIGVSLNSLFTVSEELPWAKDSASYIMNLYYQSPKSSWSLPSWSVIYFLAFFWIVIPLIVVRGGHSIGSFLKPVFGIGLLLMLVAMIRFLGLGIFPVDGGVYGLSWALHPDWSQLGYLDLWVDAFTLAIFSAALGIGLHIASASMLPRENDTVNNSLFVAITAFLLIFLMFLASASLLGGQALADGRTLDDVGQHFQDVQPEGIGTLLLVFPRAISDVLPDSTTGKALVSFSLFGSFACFLTVFITMLINSIALNLREVRGWRKLDTAFIIGVVGMLSTFVLAGITNWHWLDDIDALVIGIGVVFSVLIQCFLPGMKLDTNELRNHVNKHSELKIGLLWEFIVRVFVPIAMLIILVYNFINMRFSCFLTVNVIFHRGIILTFVVLMVIASLILSRKRQKKGIENGGQTDGRAEQEH